ncbi:MAG: bifunctional (p)ppGpp synthetase/guanosine-3',5'-bis(diphosphate) 3'-pyrophosphohydrolase [Gammaproteobacteria bacterium]|nr:bifunctional (p)ppGpp synthetase/guanosine-3',5'-bis(diphosphate) 3'-pyrophosphohydrolase [Gammaproteobacteria bacterium]
MNSNHSTENPELQAAEQLLVNISPALQARGRDLRRHVAELGLQADIEAAALLLPAIEAGALDDAALEQALSPDLAQLALGAARLPRPGDDLTLDADHPVPRAQAENIRQMLLSIVSDIRMLILRLGQVLLELEDLKGSDRLSQAQAARHVLEVYAPLANRLGIWQLKWKLEDIAFRYSDPDTYKQIATSLQEKRSERERYISGVITELQELLDDSGIKASIKGRPKHIFSIWKKLQRKDVDLDELFDLRAVRILVESVRDCYTVLGIVHGQWRHIPKEFDDYIATPKGNNYQSLHTAVIGPERRTLEIQIRTWDMHNHAELGVAAHWRYKEGGGRDVGLEEKVSWLRQLLDAENDENFLDRFQDEVFNDRIYVLSPKGAIIDLPVGSTPIDFAYHVHTEVGHRCRGAKVNGAIVPLTEKLHTGDRVEIITAKQGDPSRDWLNAQYGYVVSSRARDKIRYWFRQQSHETNLARGRAILEREIARLGVEGIDIETLARHFKLRDADAICLAVGAGDVSAHQVDNALQRLAGLDEPEIRPRQATARRTRQKFLVSGVDDLASHPARCCQPVPPDAIRGFITRGRGVSIHRADCPHLMHLENQEPNRVIPVSWGEDEGQRHAVNVRIEAHDRRGLLRDVTALMSDQKLNILSLNTRRLEEEDVVELSLTLEVSDLDELGRALHRLASMPGVFDARRVGRH